MPARRKRRSGNGWLRIISFYGRHLMLWLVLSGLGYWLWLDYEVGRSADLRDWQLPARLFATPQQLFSGVQISQPDLEANLKRLGYVRGSNLDRPGRFTRTDGRVRIHLREHEFPDGREAARKVELKFSGTTLDSIADFDRRESIALLRLEPEEIGIVHGDEFEDRVLLDINDIPDAFLDYLVAVEDRRFYKHVGVDAIGILRAAFNNIVAGRVTEGGSTITQQLVKNLYLTRTRSWTRKIREAMIAVSLERHFSKRQILEAYVNEVFLGQAGNRAIHGFGLAARFYFSKPLAELDLAQSAMLVGMVKAPSAYNPRRHPEAAARRLRTILDLLTSRGLISGKEHAAAVAADLKPGPATALAAGDFAAVNELIRSQLKRDYREDDLRYEGLKVFTTIDPRVQQIASRTSARALAEVERDRGIKSGTLELAVVVINPGAAEIVALVGGRRGSAAQFNRALNARRPFGSLVKPFVYSAALDQPDRFNVATSLNDAAISLPLASGGSWEPKNYDGRFHGPVTLAAAFTRSLNLASIDLGLRVGVDVVARRLYEVGLPERPPPLPSLLLGAVDVTPLEVAQLYQVIANDGLKTPLRVIRSVTDAGNATLRRYPSTVKRVIPAETAFLLQYLMTETVRAGTARAVSAALPDSLPLAGKTGTSNDGRDSWFAGFGGDYLAIVWVGRDDNGATGLTGASGALKIWSAFMREVHVRPLEPVKPAGIEWHTVASPGPMIVAPKCNGALRVPLAVPHGLPVTTGCAAVAPTQGSLWQRVREVFR